MFSISQMQVKSSKNCFVIVILYKIAQQYYVVAEIGECYATVHMYFVCV